MPRMFNPPHPGLTLRARYAGSCFGRSERCLTPSGKDGHQSVSAQRRPNHKTNGIQNGFIFLVQAAELLRFVDGVSFIAATSIEAPMKSGSPEGRIPLAGVRRQLLTPDSKKPSHMDWAFCLNLLVRLQDLNPPPEFR